MLAVLVEFNLIKRGCCNLMSNDIDIVLKVFLLNIFWLYYVDQDQLSLFWRWTHFRVAVLFLSTEFDDSFGNPDSMKETGLRKRYVYWVPSTNSAWA